MSRFRESIDYHMKKIRKSHVESTLHTKIVSTICDQKWETPSKSYSVLTCRLTICFVFQSIFINCSLFRLKFPLFLKISYFTLDRIDSSTKPIILVMGSCYLVRCYGNALNVILIIKKTFSSLRNYLFVEPKESITNFKPATTNRPAISSTSITKSVQIKKISRPQ